MTHPADLSLTIFRRASSSARPSPASRLSSRAQRILLFHTHLQNEYMNRLLGSEKDHAESLTSMLMAQQATNYPPTLHADCEAKNLPSLKSAGIPKRKTDLPRLPFTSSSPGPHIHSVHAGEVAAEVEGTVPLRSSSARPCTQSLRPCGRHTPQERPQAPAVADTTPTTMPVRSWTTSDAELAEAASTCGSC